MNEITRRVWSGLTGNIAFTAPDSEDERLRGRTYAIPFDDVWQTSLDLIEGDLHGWSLMEADDREGLIRAEVTGRIERLASNVTIKISLDPDGQTRVDALSTSQVAQRDLGTNARRIAGYFDILDRELTGLLARRRRTERTSAA